jgi:hypothetical protein
MKGHSMIGTGRPTTTLTAIVLGAIALLALIPAADAGLSAPHGLHATSTSPQPGLPFLAWSPVRGAEKYQVQVAADPSFKAPVLNSGFGDFTTSNTRATLKKALPSHKYWWRVRASSNKGAVSNWATSSFTLAWTTAVKRNSSGGPFVMRWRPIPGALNYVVELSSDERFATLIGGRPITTAATSAALPSTLPKNTYYWRVTPLDAEGNRGATSRRWQLYWPGPASTGNLRAQNALTKADLATFASASPQSLFLPRLSWKPSAGSVRYEVEINPDSDWAAGSRVCCTGTTVATTMTLTESLRSNRYYWRVRGLDASGNAGPWVPAGAGKDANAFTKTFDNVCSSELPENCIPQSQPSVTGLRVEDAEGNAVSAGSPTKSPIVRWDPVPGASSYEYDVVPLRNGGCDWTAGGTSRLTGTTATTAWTPLGTTIVPRPYPDARSILATDQGRALVEGRSYCVRVRAQADREQNGTPVYGDFTYLPSPAFPAFRFDGYPQGGGSSVSYRTPADGKSLGEMPVFTWHPVQDARSYWVIVAKDPSFTNIIDYAFTRIPAYAPRGGLTPKTYPDETTKYYWVVLPSSSESGACSGSQCIPQQQPHGSFLKAIPPAALRVTKGIAPTFDWNGVPGARRYDLEVSTDPHFGASVVDKVTTVATSYTATKAYPPGKKLYWRVRAVDESLVGLTWAVKKDKRGEPEAFTVGLPAPVGLQNDDRGNGGIPTWRWTPVPGAVSYDVHVELPDGTKRDLSSRVAAFTPTLMTGTGMFHWRVRANFASGFQSIPGPYSKELGFRRGITQPAKPRTIGSGRALVLAWQPVLSAKSYSVQISSRRDFTMPAETLTTESPNHAPLLAGAFAQGGRFYWRVAAIDMYGNVGKFTEPKSFALPVPPKPKPVLRPTPGATAVGVRR